MCFCAISCVMRLQFKSLLVTSTYWNDGIWSYEVGRQPLSLSPSKVDTTPHEDHLSTWCTLLYVWCITKHRRSCLQFFFSSALNEIGCTLILFAVSNSSLSRKRMNHFTPSPHVPWLLASVRACWLHFSSKKKKPKEQRSRAKCLVYVISLFLRLAVQLRHWLSFAR